MLTIVVCGLLGPEELADIHSLSHHSEPYRGVWLDDPPVGALGFTPAGTDAKL